MDSSLAIEEEFHTVGTSVRGSGYTATRRRPPIAVQALAALAVAVFLAVVAVVLFADPDPTVQGDEASYVYSALSLRGFDLSYDAADQARWEEMGWHDPPIGLFIQSHDDGWAMAKPIGYSVFLAPFLWLFGLRGIQIAGAITLIVYAGCWFFSARLRWGREVSAIVAVSASIASYTWWYAFPAHVDLFFASLVGLITLALLRAAFRRDPRWFWAATILTGFLLTEKAPAFLALLPFVLATSLRLPRRQAVVGAVLLVGAAAVATIPYWYYSDGASWSAYGGERYYAAETTPWTGGSEDDLRRLVTDEVLTPSFVLDRVTSPSSDIPSATLSYAVGRHTGALTFLPLVPLLVVASVGPLLLAARRRRRSVVEAGDGPHQFGQVADRSEQDRGADVEQGDVGCKGPEPLSDGLERSGEQDGGSEDGRAEGIPTEDGAPSSVGEEPRPEAIPVVAWGALASLVAYVAFYLVLFTNNYYGGGHSIGNRYFLQFSAVAVAIPVASGLRERWALLCSALALVWAVVVLGPLMRHGPEMYNEFWQTTSVQRLLPYDETQKHMLGVWTGPEDMAVLAGPFVYSAVDLFSTTGEELGDTRRVQEGRDAPGYVVYGPYRRLKDGQFVAQVVYESPEGLDEVVLHMDVALEGEPVAERSLSGTDGIVTTASLEFESVRATGWEFRLRWDGTGDVTVHSLRVELIED